MPRRRRSRRSPAQRHRRWSAEPGSRGGSCAAGNPDIPPPAAGVAACGGPLRWAPALLPLTLQSAGARGCVRTDTEDAAATAQPSFPGPATPKLERRAGVQGRLRRSRQYPRPSACGGSCRLRRTLALGPGSPSADAPVGRGTRVRRDRLRMPLRRRSRRSPAKRKRSLSAEPGSRGGSGAAGNTNFLRLRRELPPAADSRAGPRLSFR
jgi:hypothetical protein